MIGQQKIKPEDGASKCILQQQSGFKITVRLI